MKKKSKDKKSVLETTRIIFLSSTVLIFIFSILFSSIVISRKKTNPASQAEQKEKTTGNDCVITGCNGEICQDKDEEPLSSICIYKPEYECYKLTKCERQKNGKCAWNETDKFKACLKKCQ